MTRLYGRAPRGRRLLAKGPVRSLEDHHPRLREGRLFVAALRRDGLTAPMVLDGPMTGQAFLARLAAHLEGAPAKAEPDQ